MTTTPKATRCRQCGSKNPAGATRCRICTRPLGTTAASSDAYFEEELWSEPVSRHRERKPVNKLFVLAVAVVVLVAANYFWIGIGPDWAHAPQPAQRGSNWRVFTMDDHDVRVLLPGDPEVATVVTANGEMTVAQTWVDGNWEVLRDRHTRAPGALLFAREHYSAVVAVASTATPADVTASAPGLISAMEPAMTLSELTTTEVAFPSVGRQFDLTAAFENWPTSAQKGRVHARIVVEGGRSVVVAVISAGSEDPALFDEVVNDFLSTQAAS